MLECVLVKKEKGWVTNRIRRRIMKKKYLLLIRIKTQIDHSLPTPSYTVKERKREKARSDI